MHLGTTLRQPRFDFPLRTLKSARANASNNEQVPR
jgi:hypothetical protein